MYDSNSLGKQGGIGVGNETCRHKFIHVARLNGKFQVGHVLAQLENLAVSFVGNQHGAGNAKAGTAGGKHRAVAL